MRRGLATLILLLASQAAICGNDAETEALITCHIQETYPPPPPHLVPKREWWQAPMDLPRSTKDPTLDALLQGAARGDLAAVNNAIRDGASVDAVVGLYDGQRRGNDASRETAESQYAKFKAASRERNPILRRLDPMPLNGDTSVLTVAVIGSWRQACLSEGLHVPQGKSLLVIKRLLALGANPAYENMAGDSPIARAIGYLVPAVRNLAQREEVARTLLASAPKHSYPPEMLTRWIRKAAELGDAPIVALLIEKGADPTDGDALWNATRRGHDRVAKLLASRGAKLDMSDTPLTRKRLQAMLTDGDAKGLDIALSLGADAALASVLNENPTGYVSFNVLNPGVLHRLARANASCGPSLEYLFGHGDPGSALFLESATILMDELGCKAGASYLMAKVSDDNVALMRLFISRFTPQEREKILELAIDAKRSAPAFMAIREGGLSTGAMDSNMTRAIARRQEAVALELLSRSELPGDMLDTNLRLAIQVNEGKIALELLKRGTPSKEALDPVLQLAVEKNDTAVAAELLKRGANPNPSSDRKGGGRTLLMEALDNHNVELAEALLKAGADINARTPKMGTGPEILLNDDKLGRNMLQGERTALMRMAERGDEAAILFLLRHGADKTLKAEWGATAEDYTFPYQGRAKGIIASYPDVPPYLLRPFKRPPAKSFAHTFHLFGKTPPKNQVTVSDDPAYIQQVKAQLAPYLEAQCAFDRSWDAYMKASYEERERGSIPDRLIADDQKLIKVSDEAMPRVNEMIPRLPKHAIDEINDYQTATLATCARAAGNEATATFYESASSDPLTGWRRKPEAGLDPARFAEIKAELDPLVRLSCTQSLGSIQLMRMTRGTPEYDALLKKLIENKGRLDEEKERMGSRLAKLQFTPDQGAELNKYVQDANAERCK